MERDSYSEGRRPGSNRERKERETLRRDADRTLQRSDFVGLAERLSEQGPEIYTISRIYWNDMGHSKDTFVIGLPNSVGIVIEWGKLQNIERGKKESFREITSQAVIIIANPYGGISIEGETIVGKQLKDWKKEKDAQEKAFLEALDNPKRLVISQALSVSRQGIVRI